jgi:hypothetical protein
MTSLASIRSCSRRGREVFSSFFRQKSPSFDLSVSCVRRQAQIAADNLYRCDLLSHACDYWHEPKSSSSFRRRSHKLDRLSNLLTDLPTKSVASPDFYAYGTNTNRMSRFQMYICHTTVLRKQNQSIYIYMLRMSKSHAYQ